MLKSGEEGVRNRCPAAVTEVYREDGKIMISVLPRCSVLSRNTVIRTSFGAFLPSFPCVFFLLPFVLNLVRCSIMRLSRLDGGFIEPVHELRSISFPSMQRQKRNDACPFPSYFVPRFLHFVFLFFFLSSSSLICSSVYSLNVKDRTKCIFIRIRREEIDDFL